VSLSHWKIGESTNVSSGFSLYHCPEMWFRTSVSPNNKDKHGSRQRWTLHAPVAPCEVYISTRAFGFACSSSVYSGSMRCAIFFGICTGGLLLPRFDSDHLLFIQDFAICIIRCTASSWASSSSVWLGCIKLFTVEFNASSQCVSILVSSSGLSGTPENSYILG